MTDPVSGMEALSKCATPNLMFQNHDTWIYCNMVAKDSFSSYKFKNYSTILFLCFMHAEWENIQCINIFCYPPLNVLYSIHNRPPQ